MNLEALLLLCTVAIIVVVIFCQLLVGSLLDSSFKKGKELLDRLDRSVDRLEDEIKENHDKQFSISKQLLRTNKDRFVITFYVLCKLIKETRECCPKIVNVLLYFTEMLFFKAYHNRLTDNVYRADDLGIVLVGEAGIYDSMRRMGYIEKKGCGKFVVGAECCDFFSSYCSLESVYIGDVDAIINDVCRWNSSIHGYGFSRNYRGNVIGKLTVDYGFEQTKKHDIINIARYAQYTVLPK